MKSSSCADIAAPGCRNIECKRERNKKYQELARGNTQAGFGLQRRKAGLSKVSGCQRKLLPTWLVSAGYLAWHFFMDGVFSIKYHWTRRLLWQLSCLLQNFLTTLRKSLEGNRNSIQSQNFTKVCISRNGHHFEKGPWSLKSQDRTRLQVGILLFPAQWKPVQIKEMMMMLIMMIVHNYVVSFTNISS